MNAYRKIGALCLLCFFSASAVTHASPIVINTSEWTEDLSPSSNRRSENDGWTRLASNTPTRTSNASGSLLSDFRLTGDFTFTGTFSPIVDRRPNSSCNQGVNAICNDNDVLGLVFGWQDPNNHYRFGFGQGGEFAVSDETGNQGLFLVREVDGSSTTLASWGTSHWVDDALYDFRITRSADLLSVSISGLIRNTPGSQSGSQAAVDDREAEDRMLSGRTFDDVFLDGRVGVYTESQASEFSELRIDGTVAVPVPATATLILAASFALFGRRSSR